MLTQTTTTPVYELTKSDKRFIGWHIFFAVLALTIGSLFGPLQALQHAGVDRARIIVSSVSDNILKGVTNRQLVETARRINPGAVIIANAVELDESRHLYEAGADYVLLNRIETARSLGVAIDRALAGDIAAYRSAIEAIDGPWHKRDEVL